jgi:hypothetical protein
MPFVLLQTGLSSLIRSLIQTANRNVALGLSADVVKRVVLPTALVLLVCNMDRICLSVAILPMSQEFGWPASLQVWQRAGLSKLVVGVQGFKGHLSPTKRSGFKAGSQRGKRLHTPTCKHEKEQDVISDIVLIL